MSFLGDAARHGGDATIFGEMLPCFVRFCDIMADQTQLTYLGTWCHDKRNAVMLGKIVSYFLICCHALGNWGDTARFEEIFPFLLRY